MKVYLVICIRESEPRLVSAYQDIEKANDMLSYLLHINQEDESPMYLMKETEV